MTICVIWRDFLNPFAGIEKTNQEIAKIEQTICKWQKGQSFYNVCCFPSQLLLQRSNTESLVNTWQETLTHVEKCQNKSGVREGGQSLLKTQRSLDSQRDRLKQIDETVKNIIKNAESVSLTLQEEAKKQGISQGALCAQQIIQHNIGALKSKIDSEPLCLSAPSPQLQIPQTRQLHFLFAIPFFGILCAYFVAKRYLAIALTQKRFAKLQAELIKRACDSFTTPSFSS